MDRIKNAGSGEREQAVTVRKAALADAERLLEIYDYYVTYTAVSFEYETPSLAEFRRRMETIMARYPYLVIADEAGIQGYAYAGVFKGRAAYDWSCEMTIYLAREARGRGLGRRLYEAMEEALREKGILNLYACIAYPVTEDEYLTRSSADFHQHMGYVRAGRFHQCACKFGRWYDMIWMEKMIGEHREGEAPVLKGIRTQVQ